MNKSTLRSRLRPVAVASILACVMLAPASAGVGTTGSFWVTGGMSLGPGNTVLPTSGAWIGSPGTGSVLVDAGSFLQLGRLSFGTGGTGNGSGLITGAGTLVELVGDGASADQVQRLIVGDWGNGQLTVGQGAVLSTRANQAPCLQSFHFCDSFVGGAAGDSAALNIDGVGTQVLIGNALFVAQPYVDIGPNAQVIYGAPGGTTRGVINVTGGALLSTDRTQVAPRHWSPFATGRERNIGEVHVSGNGSRWVVTGGNAVDNATGQVFEAGASVLTANDRNALALISVTNGGAIEVVGPAGSPNGGGMTLTSGGGRTDMMVSGPGSRVTFGGDNTYLQVGRRGGSAALSVLDGASVTGMAYLAIGRDGSFGDLLVDGAGSRVEVTGTVSAQAIGGALPSVATMNIGRNAQGNVTVRNGGQVQVAANVQGSGSPLIDLGRDPASFGRLTITGSNSAVTFSARSVLPGGGPGEAFNPLMRVGRDGSGELIINQGGKLLIDGQAFATVADPRFTALYIGGSSSTTAGGRGLAEITGVGSEVRLTGTDTTINVGWGPKSFGQLSIADQAQVSAMALFVGGAGGSGVLQMNNARMQLGGEFSARDTSGALIGAGMIVGGAATGFATLDNGSRITISNAGASGAGVFLGGTSSRPGGEGSLVLAGGSRIEIQAAPGLGMLRVGRDGSAIVRMRGASSIDVGDGQVIVARDKGSDGTLLLSEHSSLNAGWVGVGRNKTDTGDVDGGTGTVVLINSTLTAPTIVVGTNGFLGGSGTVIGNVVNHGIFSPGNSPGTLEIDGSFTAQAGSRMILEVESDGAGGFLTDLVVFKNGEALDLTHLDAEFRFLGTTDPNAFGASGRFTLDTFFQQRMADSSLAPLAPALFASANFTAHADQYQITSFQFNPAGGSATIVAVPVPEAHSWAMLLAGLGVLGSIAAKRRSTVRS